MPDLHKSIARHQDLSEAKQKRAGQAIAGAMGDEHNRFLQTVIGMIDRKEIDSSDAQSLLKRDVYDSLPQEWKDKTDLELLNLTEQLRHIEQFYRDTSTPNSSPQLQTMIEHLWQVKQRIEEHYDVFKF